MEPDVLLTAADAAAAIAGNYNVASTNQIFQMYEGSIWKTTRFLFDVRTRQVPSDVRATVAGLCRVGMMLGFGLVIMQIMLDFAVNVVGHGVHPLRILQKNIMRVLLCAILLTPASYEFICIRGIGNTADNIADAISGSAGDQMMQNVRGMFSAASGKEEVMENGQPVSKLKSASIFVVSLGGNLITGLISGVVFIVAMVFILLMPMLQSALFVFVFYLGPICLPFMLFDITAGIAKAWFGFLLSVSFMGVVGSVAMLVSSTAKITNSLTFGGQTENVVFMLVYGLLSIILMAMCYPVAASLFGNTGGVATIMQPMTIANAAKAAAAATGGALAVGAVVTKGAGAIAGKLGADKLSNTLKNAGGTLSETKDHLEERRRKKSRGGTLPESPNALTDSMGDIAKSGWDNTGGRIFRGRGDEKPQQQRDRQPLQGQPLSHEQQRPQQTSQPMPQQQQRPHQPSEQPPLQKPQQQRPQSDFRERDNQELHQQRERHPQYGQPHEQQPQQQRSQSGGMSSNSHDGVSDNRGGASGGHAGGGSGSAGTPYQSGASGGVGAAGGSGNVNMPYGSGVSGGTGVTGSGHQNISSQGDGGQVKSFAEMEDLSKSRQRDLSGIDETSRGGAVGSGGQNSGSQGGSAQYSQSARQFVGQSGSFNSSVPQSRQSTSSGSRGDSDDRQKEDSGNRSKSSSKTDKQQSADRSAAQTDSDSDGDTENISNTSETES